MKTTKCLLSVILVVCVFSTGSAFAQDKPAGNVTYKKTTEYNFEDDTIEGDLTKPDGEYVDARLKPKHSNLIRIREEFKEKVMSSAGEL